MFVKSCRAFVSLFWVNDKPPLTVFVHRRLKTLWQSAGSALIAMRFVYRTAAFELASRFASVNSIPMDASFEETWTTCEGLSWVIDRLAGPFPLLTIAAVNSVVLAWEEEKTKKNASETFLPNHHKSISADNYRCSYHRTLYMECLAVYRLQAGKRWKGKIGKIKSRRTRSD